MRSILNNEQLEAINTTKGNLLILAGAGTGKTTTIVERYVNLVENHGIKPDEIIMTTFTNKAAKDMTDKIKKRTNKISPYIGTMHSLFLRILRNNSYDLPINKNFTLLTEDRDKKRIIKDILAGRGIEVNTNNVLYLLKRIEKFKSVGIMPESLGKGINLEKEDKIEEEVMGGEFISVDSDIKALSNEVYKEYQKRLKRLNKLDFDDILLYTYKLFSENNRIQRQYRKKIKAIMVDEAQDLNLVQKNILELMQNNNLCLIGDDSQNIYSWRGTSNDLIFNFDENEKKIILKDNYRSSEKIISNVNNIIKEINFKIDKELKGTREKGESIKVKSFLDLNEEMYNSLYEIKNLLQNNESPDDIAILFRVNRIGKQLERMFRKHKIPCHLSKSKGFFEREEVKDILSFIKLKINPDSLFDFERLLDQVEGIGKTKILQLKNIANKNNISVRDSLKYSEKINASSEIKEKLSRLYSYLKQEENPIESFLVFFDYVNKIREKYAKDGEKMEDKLENIEVLKELIKDYEFTQDGIRDFLDSLIEIEKKEKDKNKITLTTIHSAKGLEWKHVYLVGCNETILPSYKEQLSKIKKDDELRLFYVAVSRAKDNLTISYSENNGFKELEPSHFLEIIDADFLDQYDDEDVNWLEI